MAQLSLESIFTPEIINDPYPMYAMLRESQGVLDLKDANTMVFTRYADCQEALRSKDLGHGDDASMTPEQIEALLKNPAVASLRRTMLLMNPPDHTRLRGLVVKAFDAKRVGAMRERIRHIANELIDGFIEQETGDLVSLFNHPLPVIVICDMLGIPEADRPGFTSGTRISGRLIDPTPLSAEELEEANQRNRESSAYFADLCAQREREPQDDLLTALVQSETEHGKLTRDELTANIGLLFAAGHETTVNLLGNALIALFRNPDQLKALQNNPELYPSAVEEFLRFDSSVQLSGRTALRAASINGTDVPLGTRVITLLAAANRDPREFEEPDQLDVSRNPRPLSFGGGVHYCLGAQLARLEAIEALQVLFERLPNLALDNLDTPDYKQTVTLRGVRTLPARW